MARSGLRPLFSAAQISRAYDKFDEKTNRKLLQVLQYAGEYFVREARLNGNYRDITGNLRSSIGYCIVKDGEILQMDIEKAKKGSDGDEGTEAARRLLLQLANEHNTGLVLIGVAGMDYAVYVENIDAKDVITASWVATRHMMRTSLKRALLK